MKIYPINSQLTHKGKFRLPVKKAVFGTPGLTAEKSVNWIKEFSNPEAEKLYKKALASTDLKEKAKLFAEMGEYRIIDLDEENLFDEFFNNLKK